VLTRARRIRLVLLDVAELVLQAQGKWASVVGESMR
jgi:hypothetical protein